jgi:type I restriction enzyme S subunit
MRQTIGNLETKGSGIQNIAAVSYVKAMPINVPTMDVQRQFASFVEQVDKSKVAVQKSLDETQRLFDSLMQEYFG